jgi:hypothetical protein
LSVAVAGIDAGLPAQWDMAYAWWAYLGASILALGVKLSLQEPRPLHRQTRGNPIGSTWEKACAFPFFSAAAYFVFHTAIVWVSTPCMTPSLPHVERFYPG